MDFSLLSTSYLGKPSTVSGIKKFILDPVNATDWTGCSKSLVFYSIYPSENKSTALRINGYPGVCSFLLNSFVFLKIQLQSLILPYIFKVWQ